MWLYVIHRHTKMNGIRNTNLILYSVLIPTLFESRFYARELNVCLLFLSSQFEANRLRFPDASKMSTFWGIRYTLEGNAQSRRWSYEKDLEPKLSSTIHPTKSKAHASSTWKTKERPTTETTENERVSVIANESEWYENICDCMCRHNNYLFSYLNSHIFRNIKRKSFLNQLHLFINVYINLKPQVSVRIYWMENHTPQIIAYPIFDLGPLQNLYWIKRNRQQSNFGSNL